MASPASTSLSEKIAYRAQSDGQFAIAFALMEVVTALNLAADELKNIRLLIEEAAERDKDRRK